MATTRIDIPIEIVQAAAELGRRFNLTAEQVLEAAYLEFAERLSPATELDPPVVVLTDASRRYKEAT